MPLNLSKRRWRLRKTRFFSLLRHCQIGQHRQSTYDVPSKCLRVTSAAVQKQYYIFRACICSLNYPTCKARASCYTAIYGLFASIIFFHIIWYKAIFSGKKVAEHQMCVVIFFAAFPEICLNLRVIQRDIIINVHMSSSKAPVNETWILLTHFRKIIKYEMSWKSVQWNSSCSMRREEQTRRSQKSLFAILGTPLKTISSWYLTCAQRFWICNSF